MKNIKEIFDRFFGSNGYARLIKALGILLCILIIFATGMFAGYKKADFDARWNRNYMNAGGPHSIFAPFFPDNDDIPHGASGEIVSVKLPSILLRSRDNNERVAIINDTTSIRRFRAIASTTDLATGEQVIVLGNPDSQGRLNAVLIRILPSATTTQN